MTVGRTAMGVVLAAALAGAPWAADGPSPIRKATQEKWPITWYIPPDEGPVVGNQNGWFVTPHDILPGSFTFSGKVEEARADGFEMTPNSVWGRYRFRITRLGPADEPTPDLKLRKVVPVRSIHFADLAKLTDEHTLLFRGTLTEIGPDRKTFTADMGFRDGPIACRLDLVKAEEKTLPPDIRSMHYGPHWQHTMDIYYPEDRGEEPPPVVLYIHGGGWGALDKQGVNRSVPGWTELGFAVVSFNYRFVSNADQYPAMSPPVAAPLYDAARALQHLRYKAKELGLDTDRIAVTGGSAGGATTCWLALRDDLADPDSPDPIARQSTRITCAFPVQAQTSLDPKQMRAWIPEITYGAHAFFTREQMKTRDKAKRFAYFLAHREEILPWITEFSPYEWASKDDPPMLLCYGGQKDIPVAQGGNATHHPKFGEHLHRRLQELGVESYYWADNVKCENPRYHGWAGTKRFVCDKLLGPDWEQGRQPAKP
ncbi:MAG: alpha/beta hydrolase [Candidatus Brocadiia bacterium]